MHFLMPSFWESEDSTRAFAGHDISVAKYYDFDKDFLLELEPCSTHYEMYDKFRRYSRRLPGDLLDCCAAAGVHDPRQSDDSSRDGMLQAHGPDVRIGEHAAVALLL